MSSKISRLFPFHSPNNTSVGSVPGNPHLLSSHSLAQTLTISLSLALALALPSQTVCSGGDDFPLVLPPASRHVSCLQTDFPSRLGSRSFSSDNVVIV
ncbi:hypothetical protein ACSBR2_036444 [Camellia fascicularis]